MQTNVQGKKVLVMGLGLHGGGLAVTQWLVRHGAHVTVTDLKTAEQLQKSLDKIDAPTKKKIRFVLGKHELKDFQTHDVIVKNPGVPRDSVYLQAARNAGALIENDATLFFKYCPAEIIAVTGTRGKSTTSHLIYHFLKTGLKNRRVFLTGLPQQSELQTLPLVRAGDVVVVELSSWQLELLGEQRLAPHVSVVTNIFPDHLNTYENIMAYARAKENIFLYQSPDDYTILNRDNSTTLKMGKRVAAHRFWYSKKYFKEENGACIKNESMIFRVDGNERKLVTVSEIGLAGEHNLSNLLAAVTVAGIYAVSASAIQKVLKTFKGLPGRQQLIRTVRGVEFINDTTATTPDATMAALTTLAQKNHKLILIAGGTDKKLPESKYRELSALIDKKCAAVILLAGNGSHRIKITNKKITLMRDVPSMTDAVGIAAGMAHAGDRVVLSPSFASFGMFINEYDRGDQFDAAVKQL